MQDVLVQSVALEKHRPAAGLRVLGEGKQGNLFSTGFKEAIEIFVREAAPRFNCWHRRILRPLQ